MNTPPNRDITQVVLLTHVPAMDGLRAISILWMISFHSFFCAGYYVSREQYLDWSQRLVFKPFFQGHYGVDVFFVLSGYLIVRLLLTEKDSPEGLRVGRFYVRRLTRILPAYLVTLCLSRLFLGDAANLQSAWANVLLINNFLPFDEQALSWSWSLAIEEQFYLILPICLICADRLVARLPVLAWYRWKWIWVTVGLLVLAFAIRAELVFGSAQGWMRHPNPFHPTLDHEGFVRYFDRLYDKPYARYGAVLCGVMVAYAERSGVLLEWLRRRIFWRRLLLLTAALALLILLFSSTESPHEHSPHVLWPALRLVTDRYFFAICVAYIVLHALATGGIRYGSVVSSILSWRGFRPIAKLSYGAYLLHPLVILTLWSKIETQAATVYKPILFGMMAQLFTFVLAAVLYLVIERPCRSWGRRFSQSMGSVRSPRH